jgi:hypothetical protein
MEKRDLILKEIEEVSPLIASIGNRSVFKVSEAYFTEFLSSIMLKINKLSIVAFNKPDPYSVPQNYFQHLPDTILVRIRDAEEIKDKELAVIAPLLNSLDRKNIYSVPEQYFNSNHLNRISKDKNKARLLSFSKFSRSIVTYAAAAIMAGVMVTGVFYHPGQTGLLDVSKEINQLTDDELKGYFDEHSVVYSDDPVSVGDEINVVDQLKSLSDEEINGYLEENQSNLKNDTSK